MNFLGLQILTLQTVGDFCSLCTSACADPTLSFYMSCCCSQLLPLYYNPTNS
ncbi:unnamed protein product [Staurois parvus]|uniref:Uncharacterized protein n=1 Tax=Staurois parvus TaxID=386267 RepID=A0ABN9HAX4_9NEOB|nr:unnamed protein product [Staurois parvus]